MPIETYKIFISSTIDDLLVARTAIDLALRASEVFQPQRVEQFPAVSQPSKQVCLDEVRNSDAVVILIGQRYGFIPIENNASNLSVTHLEYREAKASGKPIFAFILDVPERDTRLEGFLQELEDFEVGVLRKKWTTIEELTREVTRSLLWWLARLARAKEGRVPADTVLGKLKEAGLAKVNFAIEHELPPNLQPWLNSIFDRLNRTSQTQLLPQLAPVNPEVPHKLSLRAEVSEDRSKEFPVLLTISTLKQDDADLLPVSVTLEVFPSEHQSALVLEVTKAFLLLLSQDAKRCIDLLLKLFPSPLASEHSKAELLKMALSIDVHHNLEYTFAIARLAVQLSQLDVKLLNNIRMNLFAAIVRFEARGLKVSTQQADQLFLQLLDKGLRSGQDGAEAVYSFARTLLRYNRKLALHFYCKLQAIHPYYDERWYYHRDLGLIFYSENDFMKAAHHYDRASWLKSDDSELFRFAGDAYYYQGHWCQALERYYRALEIEAAEVYFLDKKVAFAESRIRVLRGNETFFWLKRKTADVLSSLGTRLSRINLHRAADVIFRSALKIFPLNFEAADSVAFFANRKGNYENAIQFLAMALACIPERPAARLNLALDIIFKDGGRWNEQSKKEARAAIFHGGQQAKERFRICLVNTANRDELLNEFTLLLEQVQQEWQQWRERRKQVLKPQMFGGIMHVEIR